MSAPDACPHPHTPCPDGYLDWHLWAEEMRRTHVQARCPGCGLWALWVPRGTMRDRHGRVVTVGARVRFKAPRHTEMRIGTVRAVLPGNPPRAVVDDGDPAVDDLRTSGATCSASVTRRWVEVVDG